MGTQRENIKLLYTARRLESKSESEAPRSHIDFVRRDFHPFVNQSPQCSCWLKADTIYSVHSLSLRFTLVKGNFPCGVTVSSVSLSNMATVSCLSKKTTTITIWPKTLRSQCWERAFETHIPDRLWRDTWALSVKWMLVSSLLFPSLSPVTVSASSLSGVPFPLRCRVSTVSPVVPPLPGESDRGKQCFFLFWLRDGKRAPHLWDGGRSNNTVNIMFIGNQSIHGWCHVSTNVSVCNQDSLRKTS